MLQELETKNIAQIIIFHFACIIFRMIIFNILAVSARSGFAGSLRAEFCNVGKSSVELLYQSLQVKRSCVAISVLDKSWGRENNLPECSSLDHSYPPLMAAQKISFAAEACFLICLSLYFPVDSTQTFHMSFNGTTLANHSYVNLSLVGDDSSDDSSSVLCHTDLSTCCSGPQGIHRGDWYFPNGTRLPLSGDVYEGRAAQIVDLRHKSKGESGIYRCDIPTVVVHDDTDISVRDTVYVGLYSDEGE